MTLENGTQVLRSQSTPLIQTAVADEIEAEALARQGGRPPADSACAPTAVAAFVQQVDKSTQSK
jgi:hypothetical protein